MMLVSILNGFESRKRRKSHTLDLSKKQRRKFDERKETFLTISDIFPLMITTKVLVLTYVCVRGQKIPTVK